MSDRDPDARYEKLPQALRFFGDQLLKRVRTSLPGVIVAYDAQTSRARVQPAVDLLLTDGNHPVTSPASQAPSTQRAIILDVPVLHPAGGGYIVHIPLAVGDPVMLMFSARSIAAFKQSLRSGRPASDDIMAEQDCVAVPGFRPPSVTLRDGLSLQTVDGGTYVSIEDGRVTVTAGTVEINGIDFGGHTHGGVMTGSDRTGGPS